jgi:D-arabinitol 4-dehydrogenase
VIPCLARPGAPSPVDLPAYRDVVLDRFANDAIADTNQRVAADGFAKIPGFATAKLPALFFEFLGRWHRGELAYEYQDQGMDAASAHAIFESADPLGAFSRDPILWGPLAGDPRLVSALAAAHAEVLTFVKENARG